MINTEETFSEQAEVCEWIVEYYHHGVGQPFSDTTIAEDEATAIANVKEGLDARGLLKAFSKFSARRKP